eukprot:CAMPEP_0184685376 /NCGR_PEP_ID=MMETSP0312-20130426/18785_1 /TAXON_ID=31354 /ORGANISM="Compsopogon coeruleus, Strain SAG 36.94" /LENGTH=32 /DNA_ID= /DNA_START= /DNA_END= /DNA_ORIENTATION=
MTRLKAYKNDLLWESVKYYVSAVGGSLTKPDQ